MQQPLIDAAAIVDAADAVNATGIVDAAVVIHSTTIADATDRCNRQP